MRDLYSHTEADAGIWERAHGVADDFYDGPTAGEAEADLAADAEDRAEAYFAGPDVTTAGIRCAHCKRRHATVADVHWCGDLDAEARAEAEAEQAAEAAADVAYARAREAQAERGTWFGPQTEADRWGE